MMQANAPGILAIRMVEGLNDLAYFAEARLDSGEPVLGENFIVLEGRFSIMARGAWFGYNREVRCSSGQISITGLVKDAKDAVLAEFSQTESNDFQIPTCDADYEMERNLEKLGNDIAIFLQTWSNGESLERRRHR